jgi:hypothetical protein
MQIDFLIFIYYFFPMKNLLIVLSFIALNTFAGKDTVTVEKAALTKIIKLNIKGKGGYQGQCISMQMKSQQADSLIVYLEAGRRLDSKDSTQQDILIVKDMFVLLLPKQEKTVDVTGFCCQAKNKAPAVNAEFLVGALADSNLYALGRFINSIKLSNPTIQSAVWSISDKHEISSITDDGTKECTALKKFVAKLKGIEVPWYNIFYKQKKDTLFSGEPQMVTGNVEYYVNDNSMVMANIRDEQGTIVKSFLQGKAVQRGNHTFNMNWDVSNMPKGKYTLYVYQNGRKINELPIDLK